MTPERTLVYRFFELSYNTQIKIARKLGLDQEEKTPDRIKFARGVLVRAKEVGKLADVWASVEKEHDDGEFPINPFLKK